MAKKRQPNSPSIPKAETLVEKTIATPVVSTTVNWEKRAGWLFFLLAFLLYSPTIAHQYAFDDSIVIVENQFTKKGIAGISDLLTRDFFEGIYGEGGMNLSGGRYRPLSLLMFALEYQFFGLNPVVGHFINVLLYALTTLMLFRVLSRWFGKDSVIPFLAVLLFIVHPIHTEVVANIKSRDEILALLLLLATFQSLFRYAESRKIGWMLAAMLAFFGSMLSKESAFTFVIIIPLSLWLLEKRSAKEVAALCTALWAAALGYLMLRTAMLGSGSAVAQKDLLENPLYGATTSVHLGTVAVILLNYWRLLFAPYPLSCDYSFNQIPRVEMTDPIALISIALHISLAAFVLWKLPQRNTFVWAILVILAPLSPALNLFFNVGAPMGERFLYMSSMGFCVGAAFGLQSLAKWTDITQVLRQPLHLGAIFLVVIAFAGLTFKRNRAWYDNETLFAADVKTVPNSAKIHYYYGNTILKKYLALKPEAQEKQKAEVVKICEGEFTKAVEIYPEFHTAMYNLGFINYQKPDAQKALDYWEQTLKMMPNHILTLEMMAQLHARYLNNPDKALEYGRKLTEEAKIINNASVWQTMGYAYLMKNEEEKGLQCLQKTIELEPNNPIYWQNIGQIYKDKGNVAKADEYLKKAETLRK